MAVNQNINNKRQAQLSANSYNKKKQQQQQTHAYFKTTTTTKQTKTKNSNNKSTSSFGKMEGHDSLNATPVSHRIALFLQRTVRYSAVSLLAESTQAVRVTEFVSKGISPEKFAHVYDSSEDRSHCCCRQQKSNATVGLQYD